MNDETGIRKLALHEAVIFGIAVCARHPYEEDTVTAATVVDTARMFEAYLRGTLKGEP